jgi:hypothetical protein
MTPGAVPQVQQLQQHAAKSLPSAMAPSSLPTLLHNAMAAFQQQQQQQHQQQQQQQQLHQQQQQLHHQQQQAMTPHVWLPGSGGVPLPTPTFQPAVSAPVPMPMHTAIAPAPAPAQTVHVFEGTMPAGARFPAPAHPAQTVPGTHLFAGPGVAAHTMQINHNNGMMVVPQPAPVMPLPVPVPVYASAPIPAQSHASMYASMAKAPVVKAAEQDEQELLSLLLGE